MTVVDLIMKLSTLPPEQEVVYDATPEGSTEFKLVHITNIDPIVTDKGESLIMLYQGGLSEVPDDEDE